MKTKKLLSVVIIFTMLCTMLTEVTTVWATSTAESAFTFDSSTGTITSYIGTDTNVEIPSTIGGVNVVAIGDNVFKDKTNLTVVSIPSSVTSIGKYTFLNCSSLKSVSIPSSVTSIGEAAFKSCTKLTNVSIPNSVTSIGDSAFASCTNLSAVNIPSSVTIIGRYTFDECKKLVSVTIPSSVSKIDTYAFGGCTGLLKIYFDGTPTIGGYAFDSLPDNCKIYYRQGNTEVTIDVFTSQGVGIKNVYTPSVTGGTIVASTNAGMNGETISLNIIPAQGKRVKTGTLKYNSTQIEGTSFTMPNGR